MSTHEPPSAGIPPSMQVMQLLWPGAVAVQAIHVAAKLFVADHVAGGPKTVAELAEATKTDRASLGRLLRALSSLGIFAEDTPDRYRQTPLSDTLRSDHPQSIRRWAMMLGAGFVWEPCGALHATLRSGRTAFELVHNAPFFTYLAEHADDAAVFNAAMSSLPAYVAAFVEAYDFSRFERIVDVGGGHGAKLLAILSANPRLRGVLYDMPPVVAGALAVQRDAIGERCEIVGGDFFEEVPAGADAYLLSGIIHDWDDESAAKILRNCRRAIRPDGRLLLVETVLTPTSDPSRALMDVLMMILTGGRERTEEEFRSLLREAGFSLTGVIPTPGASILESRPV
jgi:O-methyltransferase/methyltransferase family protein